MTESFESFESFESWGRFPKVRQEVFRPSWIADPIPFKKFSSVLPYGQGRSYGDSCLNDGGTILVTDRLNRLMTFDAAAGVLRCEAGMTLRDVLHVIVPRGWFLPVSPGTQFVSVGGAVANDIHGKNHHKAGTFGRFVRRFELLRSSGERLVCSPAENADVFAATVGGLGLTGLMTWIEFSLKRIPGPKMDVETVPFAGLEDFFRLSADSDRDFEYTVAWFDGFASPDRFRGLFYRGNHASPEDKVKLPSFQARLSVPFDLPSGLLNRWTIRAFNRLYHDWNAHKPAHRSVTYRSFFYPLDAVSHWNRVYGRRGFFQYQCVVPLGGAGRRPLAPLLEEVTRSGQGSFLAVLKVFGDLASPGLLSFPRPGVTLALDFPNRGRKTLDLLERLDAVVRGSGGAVYPAKDARMSAAAFQAFFPRWREFAKFVDPKFSSSFWRRVTT
ncbi:MAG TPA: FAD-binding oxidoreductase [bacterium]|nr:FAD-binding oxidoreductase [bacterium]